MKTYDMIVIGTGAGNIILELAQKAGKSCAQIERGKFGGTCLNRGCIPTKVLVTAADRLYEIREAAHLGLETADLTVNWQQIKKRVWEKIDESTDLRETYLADESLDVYEGTAFFLDNHTVQVKLNDGTLSEPMTAPAIFIGTGGRTNIPEIEGLENVPYMTSERYFSDAFPDEPYDDVIVMGGGAIGCEFAHIFRAFGARVQLVQHNVRLLPKEDEELSAAILHNLKLDGITVHLNRKTPAVRKEGDRIYLTIKNRADDTLEEVHGKVLFICPGILPNTPDLKLENTDIRTDDRGWIDTNEFLETTVPGVYAFGDVNGRQQFRHKANYEADILGYNHYLSTGSEDKRWARYDLVPATTYSHPEVAHAGLTETQAREAGHNIKVAYNAYSDSAKGFALGYEPNDEHKAFAKLIVDADNDHILGIHVIGVHASALIQPFLNLMNAGVTTLVPINEDISSPETRALRAIPLVRNLDPHEERTVRETMVSHPSLAEVSIWTYYGFEDNAQ